MEKKIRFRGIGEHSATELEIMYFAIREENHRIEITDKIINDLDAIIDSQPNDLLLGGEIRKFINNLNK